MQAWDLLDMPCLGQEPETGHSFWPTKYNVLTFHQLMRTHPCLPVTSLVEKMTIETVPTGKPQGRGTLVPSSARCLHHMLPNYRTHQHHQHQQSGLPTWLTVGLIPMHHTCVWCLRPCQSFLSQFGNSLSKWNVSMNLIIENFLTKDKVAKFS